MSRQQRRAQERAQAKPRTFDGKGKVFVAVPSGSAPEPAFMDSLLLLHVWDAKHDGRIVNGGQYAPKYGTNVSQNRNQLVKAFLETGIEWLWFIDDDMTFEPDVVDRLLAVADEKERPIVGALCFAWLANADQKVVPTIYTLGEKDGETKLLRQTGYPRDQLVQVTATGTGCVLIHRRVFVELAKRWQTPWPWFDYMEWGHVYSSWGKIPGTDFDYAGPGDHIGEDITFCLRAGSPLGNREDAPEDGETFPVFVDTRIKCGHRKKFTVDEEEYAFRHRMLTAPPPTFVVIPVKGQHHYTESLLRQLGAQKGYQGIFVFDNGSDTDPYTGFVPDQCEVIPAAGLGLHEMWNLGVKAAKKSYLTCNIAILNNDLNIGPRFLEGLADGLRVDERIWAISPNYDGRNVPGGDVLPVRGIAAGRMDGTGGLAGFAFMVKGELFDHGLPLFDEAYHIWYGDNDFVAHIEALGGMVAIMQPITVEHIDGGSKTAGDGSSRLRSELKPLAEADRRYFEEKWRVRTTTA